MKLAVFDFDSTLINGETIEFLAQARGVLPEVASITKEAMEGKLDFYESLKARVKLLKGMEEKTVLDICKNLPLNPGAKEAVKGLKGRGYKVVCFSGGFDVATERFEEILGLDASFANALHCKDGLLSGEVSGEMTFAFSKGKMLRTLQKLLEISPSDTLVVGDGANDLSMFAHAGTKIAFCAKEILKLHADHVVEERDLRAVLEFCG